MMRADIFSPRVTYTIENRMIRFTFQDRFIQIVTNQIIPLLSPEDYIAAGAQLNLSIYAEGDSIDRALIQMMKHGMLTMADKGDIFYRVRMARDAAPVEDLTQQFSNAF